MVSPSVAPAVSLPGTGTQTTLTPQASGATVSVKFSNTNADSDVPANMVVKAPEAEIPAIKKELNQ